MYNLSAVSKMTYTVSSGTLNPSIPYYNLSLDDFYDGIVSSLYDASVQTVVCVHNTSLKPLWNNELDSLKHSAIFWHNVWVSVGRPGSGYVHQLKCSTKLKYNKKLS